MLKYLRWGVALALVCAAPLTAQDPAALVVRLQGDVQIRVGGGLSAAAVGARLTTGDEVLPGNGGRAILITRSGAQQVVTEATTIQAPPGGVSGDIFAKAMNTFAQAASSDARSVGGRQGMIRPIPGGPAVVAPRNGLTVTSTRPTFSWLDREKASGYYVMLRPEQGRPVRYEAVGSSQREDECAYYEDGGNKVSTTCYRNSWTLPGEVPALIPGTTYTWTLMLSSGRATSSGEFRVISPEEFGLLGESMDEINALGLDPSGDGQFLTAIVYRDLDLVYDAAAVLEAVEAEGGISAELYLLKGEILNRLGYEAEAREAFDEADRLMR